MIDSPIERRSHHGSSRGNKQRDYCSRSEADREAGMKMAATDFSSYSERSFFHEGICVPLAHRHLLMPRILFCLPVIVHHLTSHWILPWGCFRCPTCKMLPD